MFYNIISRQKYMLNWLYWSYLMIFTHKCKRIKISHMLNIVNWTTKLFKLLVNQF